MCCNRRTLIGGLVILLPALGLTVYLVMPRSSRQVYRQSITPEVVQAPAPAETTTLPADRPESKPPENKVLRDAIARSLGTPPVLNVIDEKKEEKKDTGAAKPLSPAPPLLSADLTAGKAKSTTPAVPPPPALSEIRTASAVDPAPAPPSLPAVAAGPVGSIPPPLAITNLVQGEKPPNKDVKCPWTLRLEVVKGRTILNAEAGKDARFRVECDLLELKAPQGSIQASGNVKISSDSLEGNSDRLTVNLQEDQVFLEGRASLVAHRQGENMEVKGERLSLRLVKAVKKGEEKSTARK